jgi:hypothetical protein
MREVRYVGPAEDGLHVIVETDDGAEQFNLQLGSELRSAVQSDLPRFGEIHTEPIPMSIRPREIQMRVRAGESPQAIADEANIAIERVLRFAVPVIEERSRVTSEARRAKARRNSPDGQIVVFGESVDARFAAHLIDPSSVTWDSCRQEDGQWVVSARWRGGDAERIARWAFSLGQRTITALDETAADLLSDRAIRPIVSIVPERLAFADDLTGPLPHPIRDEIFDQDASVPLSSTPLVAEPPMTLRAPTPLASVALPTLGSVPGPNWDAEYADYAGFDEPVATRFDHATLAAPPLPLRLADKYGIPIPDPRPEESDDERAERARIPSWDDILLGVRRKRD